jgi:hypothetical protein
MNKRIIFSALMAMMPFFVPRTSHARDYNPNTGRFQTMDPFSANQQSGANLYIYGADDPVNNSDPSGLYEIDVHQYLTMYLAGKAGFGIGSDAASQIGKETQRLDEDGRSATSFLPFPIITGAANMSQYHFVGRDRLIKLAGDITGTKGLSDFKSMGIFLHAQEDTYAHCTGQDNRNWDYLGGEGGGIFGHACDGHDPDHTWLKPDKGVIMAMRVYTDLKNLAKDGKFSNNPNNESLYDVAYDPNLAKIDWSGDDMNRIVKFMYFNPGGVKGGAYLTGPGWTTVTRAGMLAKVQVLFPGYSIDKQTIENNWLRNMGPVKPLSSPRMHGIGVTTDMTVSGIIGGSCP